MIGVVYLKSNNQIISVIQDVQSYNSTDVTGIDSSIKGIDSSLADFKILSNGNYNVGDILGSVTDTRSSLPLSDLEKVKLAASLSSADFQSFMDYFFTKFPE